jgi:AbrB family looped-hinge helix DNA binding protein
MNARTTLSAKGQVVIPKDVRDRLGLRPGQQFDVSEAGGALVLRPTVEPATLTVDELREKLRTIIHYDEPPVTIEQMNEAIREAWIASAARSNCARD